MFARNTLRVRLRVRPPSALRFQHSSTSRRPPSEYAAALYGGVAGGAVVLAGAYAWYHFSGARTVVETARDVISLVKKPRRNAVPAAAATTVPSDPVVALAFMRFVAKSLYPFPGLDRVFDELEIVTKTHGDRVVGIVSAMYRDVYDVLSSPETPDSGKRVLTALRQAILELVKLSRDVSGDVIDRALDESPVLKRILYDNLSRSADEYSQEAQRIASNAEKVVRGRINDLRERNGFDKFNIPGISRVKDKITRLKEPQGANEERSAVEWKSEKLEKASTSSGDDDRNMEGTSG